MGFDEHVRFSGLLRYEAQQRICDFCGISVPRSVERDCLKTIPLYSCDCRAETLHLRDTMTDRSEGTSEQVSPNTESRTQAPFPLSAPSTRSTF